MTRTFAVPCLIGLLVLPLQAAAQDQRSFGVNFGVVGTQQLGITYHVIPAVTLRPAITFGWGRYSAVDGAVVAQARTDLGLGLDLLFPMVSNEELTPYLGIGGNMSHVWYGGSDISGRTTKWGVKALFGVRASLMERLAAYGELVARYSSEEIDFHRRQITVGTTALGVIVYFD